MWSAALTKEDQHKNGIKKGNSDVSLIHDAEQTVKPHIRDTIGALLFSVWLRHSCLYGSGE
ncbi:hypothetical protein KSD_76990 [Ktedonobacter sp. SOSP1-85]|nr:hypothetical protein KSD_76990 [Ktedonobacter sp. SOSP1-85]